MADVRSKLGAPILDDFNSSSGTPIVVNQTTGGISVLKDDDTIQEMALVAGSSSQDFAANNLTVSGTLTETTGASWASYTPTISADVGTWGALTVTKAKYRKLGKTLFISIDVNATVASGSPTEGRITLPSGLTCATNNSYDTCYLVANGVPQIGFCIIYGGASYIAYCKENISAFTATVYFRITSAIELS